MAVQTREKRDEKKSSEEKKMSLKIRAPEKELEERTKLADAYLNQLKYLQADFENYKKSVEKEKRELVKLANEKLIKELLTIIDDFERAIDSVKDKEELRGVELIYKNILKILEGHGLKKIECLGKKFDPYYHEVVLKANSDKEDGTIIDELQKGYLLHSKVLRYAKVKVSDNS